jgi:regulating synaptic membrane exocytosis protein 2
MILQKSLKESSLAPASSATILGLKVVGGQLLSNGRYGAIIEKVKKGTVADTVGHLLPGKTLSVNKKIFHS